MELVVPFVSALLGLSVAFFLSISVYDMLPEQWARFRRSRRSAGFAGFAGERQPLLPRTIRQTQLN